ncbi:Transcriptional regulator, contains XRE-family HTH domain [Tsukamurella pulmonis]|uniref:Transcriptional regulator, contains XRE-family HTH domain n=1 Tax=Tsukamurella pulmonis TaxID=47312 RepID=A0A1H1H0T4_9ACTN|nr:helix-turn-helix domain-containing protein [Tsukamurella pulmonis]SDR19001.1 Transcriptional regulator, contains XRE-family HTH domain [Tsukamurella pulmonis]
MTCGEMIRDWRVRRRRTQLDVALAVGVSARHLSFVETGRARPSRRLVTALGEQLDMPLGARNEALLAAGFAPVYTAHGLDDAPMRPVRAALETVLAAHAPYPAMVLGAGFDLVTANTGAALFVTGVDAALLEAPLNVMRLTLHPDGLVPRLLNHAQVRDSALARVRRSYERTADPRLGELYRELRAYPAPPRGGRDPDPAPGVFVPFRMRDDDGAELSFVSTLTTFGGPHDVVLESLVLEAFYPADPATRRRLDAGAGRRREQLDALLARAPHIASHLPQGEWNGGGPLM